MRPRKDIVGSNPTGCKNTNLFYGFFRIKNSFKIYFYKVQTKDLLELKFLVLLSEMVRELYSSLKILQFVRIKIPLVIIGDG